VVSKKSSKKFFGIDVENLSLTKLHNDSKSSLSKFFSKVRKLTYSCLKRTMNYQPVNAGNQTNPSAGFQDKFDAEKVREEVDQQYLLFPVWSSGSTNPQNYDGDVAFDDKEHDFDAKKPNSVQSRKQDDKTKKEAKGKNASQLPDDLDMPELKDITYSDDEDVVGAEADFNNLESFIPEEPKRVHQALKDPSWIEAI
nr:hypothetical protein [Tanacetum cinerariifolium]